MGPPKLRAPPARPEGAQTVTKSAKDIFTEWDKDANGLIDFDEFVEVRIPKSQTHIHVSECPRVLTV